MTRNKILLVGSALLGIVAIVLGCSDSGPKFAAPHHPLAILGIDGMEWRILRPLLRDGKMPNLRKLIERGSAGKLVTLSPSWSPVLWTTVVTGKMPQKHGITYFLDQSDPKDPRPFTSNARHGRALWNIASEYGLTTLCSNWWVTWPAEEIRGYMVAPYSAKEQFAENWKGSFRADLPDLTWPRELAKELAPIADRLLDKATYAELDKELFGGVELDKIVPAEREFVKQTRATEIADQQFTDMAAYLLDKMKGAQQRPDLVLTYIGLTDVTSHRFWRYAFPDEFSYTIPGQSKVELNVLIERAYLRADKQIGEIVSRLPEDTNIIVCSDHGFHAIDTQKLDEKQGYSQISGHHMDGPTGIFIAAGPDIVDSPASDAILNPDDNTPVKEIGRVVEVFPVALYLLGLPLSKDGESPNGGMLIRKLVKQSVLDARPPTPSVFSHDDGFRAAGRALAVGAETANSYREALDQLGYLMEVEENGQFREVLPSDPANAPGYKESSKGRDGDGSR